MRTTRTSPLGMALALLLIALAAFIATGTRAAATNCPYTVDIATPPCLNDFPMTVTVIYGSGTTNTNIYPGAGQYVEPTPVGAGGSPIVNVRVNGTTVPASAVGVQIPSACPGWCMVIRVYTGPNGCPWVGITWVPC